MKKLPVGEQDFTVLREEGYVYVDKTAHIHRLMTGSGRFFFLSRPRRFGKSLLLSTMKAVFEGRKDLFDGLYIYDKIDWNKHYPVIHLDMSSIGAASLEVFNAGINTYLDELAIDLGCGTLKAQTASGKLLQLINQVYRNACVKVAILIDEYDKPIQDTLHKPELAAEIRDILRSFYTVIKSRSESIHFVFLTGVSKISQVSIFSGLNNLNDISLDGQYAAICGYTQEELETGFTEHIGYLAVSESLSQEQLLEKIKYWYNGYSWDGEIFVYNPFSTLLLLEKRKFDPHWFDTGTPTFLLDLMAERGDFTPVLKDELLVSRMFSGSQALEEMDTVALFFQTGYLTIKKQIGDSYRLEIPNNEVRYSLYNFLLPRMTGKTKYEVKGLVDGFRRALEQEDPAAAVGNLRLLFAHITYDTHLPYEAHYQALLQMALLLMGVSQQSEVHTDKGRPDCIIWLPGLTYVTELKYAAEPKDLDAALVEGMAQIHRNRYYETSISKGRKIWLLALAVTKGEMAYQAELYTV